MRHPRLQKGGTARPWQERTVRAEREEFLACATQEGANISALCRHFGISRKTAYKWLDRLAAGERDVRDRSRRPHTAPRRTPPEVEAAVLARRDERPAWGGRKLHHVLARQDVVQPIPAPSTITAILRRHDRLVEPARPTRDYVRFEEAQANGLWQLDFMGQPDLPTGKVHPLTVVDDPSRFALVVAACPQAGEEVVREHLTTAFRRYGLPRRILSDNGPPWGAAGAGGLTALEAWWRRLGIAVTHGRPLHPQTQGKLERLHRTIWAEVPGIRDLPDLATAQRRFDRWRTIYNQQRPHEALAYAVPAERYQPSERPFPAELPPIVYGPDDAVRRVYQPGRISFRGREYFISHGLVGQPVAVRPTSEHGQVTVWYCQRQVATLDLAERV
jgi:transposase InsO family protein